MTDPTATDEVVDTEAATSRGPTIDRDPANATRFPETDKLLPPYIEPAAETTEPVSNVPRTLTVDPKPANDRTLNALPSVTAPADETGPPSIANPLTDAEPPVRTFEQTEAESATNLPNVDRDEPIQYESVLETREPHCT